MLKSTLFSVGLAKPLLMDSDHLFTPKSGQFNKPHQRQPFLFYFFAVLHVMLYGEMCEFFFLRYAARPFQHLQYVKINKENKNKNTSNLHQSQTRGWNFGTKKKKTNECKQAHKASGGRQPTALKELKPTAQ